MRHRVRGRKLSRTNKHRLALRRNLVQSLFEHGEVRTTLVKAKEVKAFAEKLITMAIDGTLAARQRAEAVLTDRAVIPKDSQEEYDRMSDAKRNKVLRARSGRRWRTNAARPGLKFTAESLLHKLFADVGPRMKKRNEALKCSGGYTRIIKLPDRRLGDAGPLAILQLVKEDEKPRPRNKDKTERKRRARVKYTVYAGKPRPHTRRRAAGGKGAEAKGKGQADGAPAETGVEPAAAPESGKTE